MKILILIIIDLCFGPSFKSYYKTKNPICKMKSNLCVLILKMKPKIINSNHNLNNWLHSTVGLQSVWKSLTPLIDHSCANHKMIPILKIKKMN